MDEPTSVHMSNLVYSSEIILQLVVDPMNYKQIISIYCMQLPVQQQHSQIFCLPTFAGNDLLSDFERYGGFHLSIAQVPLSDTFLMSRGGRVGSEIINDYVFENGLNNIYFLAY